MDGYEKSGMVCCYSIDDIILRYPVALAGQFLTLVLAQMAEVSECDVGRWTVRTMILLIFKSKVKLVGRYIY
jgi:hypothetical protein